DETFLNSNKTGGNGASGRVSLTYTQLTFKSQLVSMSLGSPTWCAGETRNVSIQIKNIGTATWNDVSGQDINIGVKWNTNGTSWNDYYVRVDAAGLTPGATGTYNFTITASNAIAGVYGTPLAAGTNNLTFDLVYEGVTWFGDNGGGVGPGNVKFVSTPLTINSTIATFSYTASPYCQSAANPLPTYSGGGLAGTFTSTSGLVFVNSSTGQVNLASSTPGTYTVTNTRDAAGCSQQTATASITITPLPIATFSYTGSPFCKNEANPLPTFSGGGAGGSFTSTSGLVFVNSTTGEINLASSAAGTYTVTNTRVAAAGCAQVIATFSVTITTVPVATFSYTGNPYCQSATNPSPVFSGGGAAGTFTSTPGLIFVSANTGVVNLSASTQGTYTVTNTRATVGGCPQIVATASITITPPPVATFSYPGTPFCKDEANPLPSFSGAGLAGTFTSTAGLVFVNSSTGEVNLASSTAGTYIVTNFRAAAGGCSSVSSTASITINALPTSVTATAASAAICWGSSVAINGSTSIASSIPATLFTENFNGTPTFTTTGSNTGGGTAFSQRASGYLAGLTTITNNIDASRFMIAVATSFGAANTASTLTSSVINTNGYTSLNLGFNHSYAKVGSSTAIVEVSTDGGSSWTTLKSYTSSQGANNNFIADNINLNAYINQSNLKIRFNTSLGVFFATAWWAIDNVVINGAVLSAPQYTWTASPAAVLPNTATIIVNPTVNTTYTLTATDPVTGCSASAAPVLITAYPKPTLNAIANVVLNTNADGLGNCSAVHNWTHPLVNTACSTTLTVAYTAGSPVPATIPTGGTVTAGNPDSVAFFTGATIVTYTATDTNGNIANTSFTVTVTDNELPSITCAADVIVNNTAGQCDATVILSSPVTTDNCGILTVTNDHSSSNVFPVGVTNVIWTAKDIHNNISTCTQKVTVNDTELPTIVCSGNVSVPNDTGECGAAVTLTPPTTDDACAGVITIATRSDALTLADPYPVGPTTVIWKVTDAAGNFATCNQLVTVTDTEQPKIICPNAITTVTDPAAAFATITLSQPVVTDNCGGTLTVVNDHPAATFPIGTTFVNWTVTDSHGLTNTCVQTIVVNDEIDPSIANNPPINLNNTVTICKGATDISYPEASDNSGHVTVTSDYVGLPTPSVDPVTPLAVPAVIFPVGQTTIIWTAIDPSLNDSWSTQMITVTDNEPPTITCPPDITQANDTGLCSAVIALGTPATGDNCGVLSVSNDHGSTTYPIGETIVIWTVTDIHSNSSTCTQKVTVTDTELPTITCASDVSVNNDTGLCTAEITLTPPATNDNCAVATVTNDHISPIFAQGDTIVKWTVTDIHGNINTCTQKVTVLDNELPVITAPADILQTADASQCGAAITIVSATTTDNCGVGAAIGTRSDALALTAPYPVGTTTISWNATDVNGNNALAKTQTVKITDNEKPVISGMPSDFAVNNDAGNCSKVVTWTAPTATDNCDILTLTSDYVSGAVFPVGTTIVTYTATDIHNNFQIATFKVIVTDNEKPAISGMPSNLLTVNDPGNCSAVVNWIQPQPADNCAIATLVSNHASGDAFAVGTTTVTYTATDIHDNFLTASFDVVVTDSELPVITNIPANIALNNDAGICGAIANWSEPNAADNCNIASFTSNHISGEVFPIGTTTVTYTATDIHGSMLTASFDVIVTDNTKPVIATNGDINVDTNTGVCGATVLVSASATDNCGVNGVPIGVRSDNQALNGLYPVGTTTIAWNVSDINGNPADQVIQTIFVKDNEKPVAIAKDITIQLDASGVASIVASDVDNGSNDACGIKSLAVLPNTFTCANVGPPEEVTLTVTDNNDNVSTITSLVTVEDNVNPVVIAKNITVHLDNSGQAYIIADDVNNGSTDACGIMNSTVSPNTFTCANVGAPVSVVLKVTDNSGNFATATAIVTVQDPVAPIAIAQDVTVQLDNTGNGSTTAATVNYNSSDACGIQTLVLSKTAFTCADIATNPNEVTLTVTDNNNNVSTATAIVTVKDEIAPVAVAQNVIIQLNASGNGTTTAALVNNGSSDACGIETLTLSKTAFTCANLGPNPVLLTVTDNNGNISTTNAVVTVIDSTNPVIICTTDKTVNANNVGCTYKQLGSGWDGTATDNCNISIKYTLSGATTSSADAYTTLGNVVFNLGVTTVTAYAYDTSNNMSNTCTFKVTVSNNMLKATIATNNPALYYGYTGDQKATITATPSGGTAPYTIKITMMNGAGTYVATPFRVNGQLICGFMGGNEIWTPGANTNTALSTGITCATATVSASSTSNPISGSYSVDVTLMADARFIATVTDANGCSYTIPYEMAAKVDAEDARCFAGNSGNAKVTICHKTGSAKNPCVTICVDESAVQEHLAHGDFIGKCTTSCQGLVSNAKEVETEEAINPFKVIVYPNPSHTQFTLKVDSNSNEKVEVIIYDMMARMIKRIEKSDTQTIPILFGEELPAGEYLTIVKQGKNMKSVNVVKK
ncbi:MAG: HYR domain-containing protein, partial [Flavobacterium sp.]|nr:HYR domain-containing protein [Flavobacterium sp.]